MNAIMKTNNVSMISNIINGKLFKKSYLKEIDNFSLNSFFYNQRIRRFKELVLLELIFKHGSRVIYKIFMNRFERFLVNERYFELLNLIQPEYFDRSILSNLFMFNFFENKRKLEIKNELSLLKKPAVVQHPTPVSKKRKAEDAIELRIVKKPRIDNGIEIYISRLKRKLQQLRKNLEDNKNKGAKFWTISDEIIIDCIEYDLRYALDIKINVNYGFTDSYCYVNGVRDYYKYIISKHNYIESKMQHKDGYYVDVLYKGGRTKNVRTLIAQIKYAINQHCVNSMQHYVRRKSDKTYVIIPKNERKLALFTNEYMDMVADVGDNKMYWRSYQFKAGEKLDDETVQKRIDILNSNV